MLAQPASPLKFNRLLLTGAAGNLGRELRPRLKAYCKVLRLSHRSDLGAPGAGEEVFTADLADKDRVHAMLADVDAVVHMGGVSTEQPWEPILAGNIVGMVNLYEAARQHGTKRIVFASSNHVTGCYEQGRRTHPDDPPRPDGNYGLSKLFGEGMARLYWDRHGIESVCLRIGTATPDDRPPDRRALATWLSHADLARLVIAALTAPGVGFLVAYGMSDNPRGWWDTSDAWARLGYQPQDTAERFADEVQHRVFPPDTPMARLQGGSFLGLGPYDLPLKTDEEQHP